MKPPVISVIMATYNHADFVAQAITSVLHQQDADFEFLIADDGSTDATRDVVASMHDDKIRFFPCEVNRGACVVTNELIQRASGEFIALINSDDYWTDDHKLAYQLEILRANPHLGACFGRARFVDKNGSLIDKSSLPYGNVFDQENRSQGAWLRRFFDSGNCFCHPTMLIRKTCYDNAGGYNNRFRQLPDFDMWIRLVKMYTVHISDRELINFRILPGENASSHTSSNSIRTINEHFLVADSFFSGVDRSLLVTGFGDLLVNKDVPTEIHLDIEIALIYFIYNQWLGRPYLMVGLLIMNRLLNSGKHREVLQSEYGIDDRWFHERMAEVDVLRPKLISSLSEHKISFSNSLRKVKTFFVS